MAWPQMRCARNMAGPEEDCGGHVAYVPCREPAPFYIEMEGWWACMEHAIEVLRENDGTAVTGDIDGEPMVLGDDGELRRAS